MPKTKRTPTGIDGLDRLLHGGLPKGSTSLLVGAPGTGKTVFCKQFMHQGLSSGDDVIYIISSQPIDLFTDSMKAIGWDISPYVGKTIHFIDLYSWRVKDTSTSSEAESIAPAHLNDLNMKTRHLLEKSKGKNIRLVMDSLSDLLLYEDPTSIFKFMQLLVAQVRTSKATGLVVLESGLHSDSHEYTLEYITDNLIETKLDRGKRFLRLKKITGTSHPLEWIEYKISGKIDLKVSSIFN